MDKDDVERIWADHLALIYPSGRQATPTEALGFTLGVLEAAIPDDARLGALTRYAVWLCESALLDRAREMFRA